MTDAEQPTDAVAEGEAAIRTFLIADVRGYTSFTQRRGDEAAAALAARFAGIAREHIAAHGGRLIELRGDEALAVFGSARRAIHAALELQSAFVEQTEADPTLPLPVGIGLDAGEAVPVEDGFRGGALNLAARLCSRAGPGDVLASQEVVHLARTVPGARYEDQGEFQLKGLDHPVRAVRVLAEGSDLRSRIAPFVPEPIVPPRRRSFASRHRGILIGAVIAVLAATLIPIALLRKDAPAGLPGVSANSVGLLDPRTGTIRQEVGLHVVPSQVAADRTTAWVTSEADGSVSRIDLRSGSVQRIQAGSNPTGITYGDGAVWVTDSGNRSLERINPATDTVVQQIPVGNSPRSVAVGSGGVWVANSLDDTVSRIDPRTGHPSLTIPVGGTPVAIALGDGAVWTANSTDGTVSRIDLGTAPVVRSITVGNGPDAIAFADGAIWVANGLDGTVSRIDPATDTETDRLPVEEGPTSLAASGGSLWVASQFGAALSRIDLGTRRVTDHVALGSAPVGTAIGGGLLLVSTRGSPAGHRGGTLTIVSPAETAPGSFDPAFVGAGWPLLGLVYDSLVGYKRVGGIDGSTLVPDLATSLPTPTEGGTVYTFSLERNLLFSDGTPVRAGDVRRSFERALRLDRDQATLALGGIVGADGCSKDACDLSSGIVTDDAAGTVTFRLRSPDAEFLYKLALPPVAVVSGSSPMEKVSEGPPGTGPYMIGERTPTEVTLVRNPHFHLWSAAAQPDGFPDRIAWRSGGTADQAVARVESGDADYFGIQGDTPSKRSLAEIATSYTAQAHLSTLLATWSLYLNTRVQPFDDPRVRRALAYALDRDRMAALYPQKATVTCQVIPPNFIGYQPYCPYTVSPNPAGTWTAADLVKARSLIPASDEGETVTVWSWQGFAAVSRYVVGVLNDLGFHARLHATPDFFAFYQHVADSRNRAQIAGLYFLTSDPLPSELVDPTFTCDGFERASPQNFNVSEFCDPSLDALIRRATQTQVSDPHTSRVIWTKVDRELVDRAPAIPAVIPETLDLVSPRVGNYQHNPAWGVLIDQLWVR